MSTTITTATMTAPLDRRQHCLQYALPECVLDAMLVPDVLYQRDDHQPLNHKPEHYITAVSFSINSAFSMVRPSFCAFVIRAIRFANAA